MLATANVQNEIITFGYSENNDYYPANITFERGAFARYDLMHRGDKIMRVALGVPGSHNVLNSVAACAAALYYGASIEAISSALNEFGGAHRRFEIVYNSDGITIADDYAHHPKELRVTLQTAKSMDYKRVIAVFQPFTYSRTAMLLGDFADALAIADLSVLSEIMGSREVNTIGIHSADLAKKIDKCVVCPEFDDIAKHVSSIACEGDLIITLGCGDIYKVIPMIETELKNKKHGL